MRRPMVWLRSMARIVKNTLPIVVLLWIDP
jgi:hypothetical protein